MRLVLLCAVLALSGCITIHTIDLGARRSSLGSKCNVPMNKGGAVPSGWLEIGRVQIEGASDWSEAQFADEFRNQACEMGAQYVVVQGDNAFMEGKFLMQEQRADAPPPQQQQQEQPPAPPDDSYAPYVPPQTSN
jgi:hypothetical protein